MRRILLWLLLIAALILSGWLLLLPERKHPAPPPRERSEGPVEKPEPTDARDAAPLVPYDPTPSALAGEPVTIELMEPPAERYADATLSDADKSPAALVESLGRADVTYDPALGRAARELAFQQSLLIGLAPQDVIDFLLRSAGAVDRTVEQGFTATSGDGSSAARERLVSMLGAPRAGQPARVGVGEVWIPGAKLPRVIAVLISRRAIEIDPAPRAVPLGVTWTLSGALPPGHAKPSALVLRPDGVLADIPVDGAGRRFSVDVPVGTTPGSLHVSLGAVSPEGPTTLVQLSVEVGRPLPSTYATRLPPDERAVTSVEAAEALAFELLNADRARFGLPLLARDRRLDAIAREHSADMRDHGFFAHRSPTTGGPGDRLAAARYRALSHAENIATEASLHGAEQNLLASLGHRKNILNGDFTHVGIGVARGEPHGAVEYHLTQLFARPVVAIDAEAQGERLRAAISGRRRAAGLSPLSRDGGLDRIAREHARAAALGNLEGLPALVLDDAKRARLIPGKAQVWIQSTPDVAAVEPPALIDDAAYGRVGIGIVQLPDDPHGMAAIILILASAPPR
jgi:uncharacterized protein YkwD